MLAKIFILCAIINILNGINGQITNGAQPQSDDQYVFDLPPLQIKPLQIRVNPSMSTLFLIRSDGKQGTEFIPIDQYEQNNGLSAGQKANLNQISPLLNNLVPNPQVTQPPLQKTQTQPIPQLPKESSVEYDVPSVQSVLKQLLMYTPFQLPDKSLLYQQSVANSQSPESQTNEKNTRFLPAIMLPAITIQGDELPIQTIAVELPQQELPGKAVTPVEPPKAVAAEVAPPKPQLLQPLSPQTLRPQPLRFQPLRSQPFRPNPLPPQPSKPQPLLAPKLPAQTIQPLNLPLQTFISNSNSNAVAKQPVFFIQTFAEAPSDGLQVVPSATAQVINLVKPTANSNVKSYSQKPITTEIRRHISLASTPTPTQTQTQIFQEQPVAQPEDQPVAQPLAQPLAQPFAQPFAQLLNQIQTLSAGNPSVLLLNDEKLEPYSFLYDLTDASGNRQSRKEEFNTNGVVTGNYKYVDANGLSVEYTADQNGFSAGIGNNESGAQGSSLGLSSVGVKVNSKPSKTTKKPTLVSNKSAPARKFFFTQRRA